MIRIFDSGEKYIDRYTVVIESSMYTMSEHARMPDGVNMYCCEVSAGCEGIGEEIAIEDAPKEVRWAILDRLKGHVKE